MFEKLIEDLRSNARVKYGARVSVEKTLLSDAVDAIEKLLSRDKGYQNTFAAHEKIIADLQAQLSQYRLESAVTKAEEIELYCDAIKKWGDQAQVMMVYEEMAELQKELCKNWRGRDNIEQIADEVADVEIMLAQLELIYDISERVRQHKALKLMRLRKRLEGAVE